MKKKVKLRISPENLTAQDIMIRTVPLPLGVKGFCTYKKSGYIVCINQKANETICQETLAHELKHILNHDLHSEKPVSYLES